MTPWSRGVAATNSSLKVMVGRICVVNHYMHCYIIIEAVVFMVSLGRFLKERYPHYKSMEANDPQGVDNLDSRGRLA